MVKRQKTFWRRSASRKDEGNFKKRTKKRERKIRVEDMVMYLNIWACLVLHEEGINNAETKVGTASLLTEVQ
jgi:hypothetical protein